jgi:phenylalanyl-tRNA synthetase beta chain
MRIVWSWLKDYVDLAGVSPEEMAERWTLAGLEAEAIEPIGDWWDPERVVVGRLLAVRPHPNADRLVLADVDVGAGAPHPVVTGAPNLLGLREAGELPRPLTVAFAREGAALYDGHAAGWVKTTLKGRPVRGVMSDAMVCSAKELGLSEDHEGILVLDGVDEPAGTPLVEVLGDTVVELAVPPSMSRCLSVVGVARETAAILGRSFRTPFPLVETVGESVDDYAAVLIADPDLCPRYTARLIRGLTLGPSPYRLQRRLSLAGMRPISNVVDITNYVMLAWGEPLHAFDYDALLERAGGRRPTITVRRARAGERMTTLDGVARTLDTETLLITDEAGALAIAGVMGGAETEVTDSTRTVLLEAAAFDFINVRRTSRAQKLASESALRFGRGVHPALAETASTEAAELLRRLAGGEVLAGLVDAYPRAPAPVVVRLPAGETRRVLGVDIPAAEEAAILRRLEFEVELEPQGDLVATVPPHRLDVGLPVDLIEEVARIHGYDRLPSTLLADPLPPQRDNPRLALEETVRDQLVAAGLQEVVSYRLVARGREALVWADPAAAPADYVSLANPISPERSVMRRSILTGLLEAAARNLRQAGRVALFELGQVYEPLAGALPEEPERLGLLLTGPAAPGGWRPGDERPLDFYDAKGAVTALLEHLGVAALWQPGEHPSLHPGRTAAVTTAAGTLVGHVGELHPLVRAAWDLPDQPVALAELDLEALLALGGRRRTFQPVSPYPAVREDLAVVVDEALPAADVAEAIQRAAGPLLVELALFDVYRGAQVGAGKKSLAWSLAFQAPDKTLTGEAAARLRQRIVAGLERELGARVRSGSG